MLHSPSTTHRTNSPTVRYRLILGMSNADLLAFIGFRCVLSNSAAPRRRWEDENGHRPMRGCSEVRTGRRHDSRQHLWSLIGLIRWAARLGTLASLQSLCLTNIFLGDGVQAGCWKENLVATSPSSRCSGSLDARQAGQCSYITVSSSAAVDLLSLSLI